MRNGGKLNLPIYYRNKIFTEEEREKLFLDKIEKGIVYVLGHKLDLKQDYGHYMTVLVPLFSSDINVIAWTQANAQTIVFGRADTPFLDIS